MIAKV